jgi:putative ABC transport system permease protein
LVGLSALIARQRTKEVGIRKVLGASVSSIVTLLSKDFVQLVAIAFLIAAPIAYLVMHKWLETFANRIDVGAGIFLAAGGLVLSISILAVGYQAMRAALADPVKSLRFESY